MKDYKPKNNVELKQLAMDIYDEKVFTNRHISPQRAESIKLIFLPIVLGALKDWTKEELEKIGLIYEYYDKAGPRAVNGHPSFTSFNYLDINDVMKVDAFYVEYKTLKETYGADPNLPNQV